MVGVRDPVRARARLRDDRVLVDRQRRVPRARQGEDVGDRLRALRVGDRVPAPVVDAELHLLLGGDPRQQLRTGTTGGPDLQVRAARPADRPTAEQRAAQVGAPAARPPDDPLRRRLQRRVRDESTPAS